MNVSVLAVRGRVRRRGFRQASRRAFERVLQIPLLPLTIPVLRRRIRSVSSIDDAVGLAYGFGFGGVNFIPWQEESEIRALLTAVAALCPRAVLEIGTSNGGTLFLFARIAAADALLVSVDLPHGEFGGGYPRWRSRLYRAFASPGQRIHLLRANSHDPQTRVAVCAALEGRQVDVLFIDGDHTYEGVKHDFEMYRALVRRGGVIAFHDIVPRGQNGPVPRNGDNLQGGNVPTFWAEIRPTHDVTEYVDNWAAGRFGIGAVKVT